MEVVAQAGAQFAFPSMVYYEAQDTPHNPSKVRPAEGTISEWHDERKLRFPEFSWQENTEPSSTPGLSSSRISSRTRAESCPLEDPDHAGDRQESVTESP